MSIQPEILNTGATPCAMVFLRGEKGADFAEIHSKLLLQDGVVASVPMLGDWNFLLRMAAKDRDNLKQLIERICSLKGVAGCEAYFGEEAWTAPGESIEQKAAACAVLDVNSDGLAALTTRLRAMPEIAEGNVSDGGKRIVLFLRGNSSREIRDVVGDKIRLIPGVLRVKLHNAMVN